MNIRVVLIVLMWAGSLNASWWNPMGRQPSVQDQIAEIEARIRPQITEKEGRLRKKKEELSSSTNITGSPAKQRTRRLESDIKKLEGEIAALEAQLPKKQGWGSWAWSAAGRAKDLAVQGAGAVAGVAKAAIDLPAQVLQSAGVSLETPPRGATSSSAHVGDGDNDSELDAQAGEGAGDGAGSGDGTFSQKADVGSAAVYADAAPVDPASETVLVPSAVAEPTEGEASVPAVAVPAPLLRAPNDNPRANRVAAVRMGARAFPAQAPAMPMVAAPSPRAASPEPSMSITPGVSGDVAASTSTALVPITRQRSMHYSVNPAAQGRDRLLQSLLSGNRPAVPAVALQQRLALGDGVVGDMNEPTVHEASPADQALESRAEVVDDTSVVLTRVPSPRPLIQNDDWQALTDGGEDRADDDVVGVRDEPEAAAASDDASTVPLLLADTPRDVVEGVSDGVTDGAVVVPTGRRRSTLSAPLRPLNRAQRASTGGRSPQLPVEREGGLYVNPMRTFARRTVSGDSEVPSGTGVNDASDAVVAEAVEAEQDDSARDVGDVVAASDAAIGADDATEVTAPTGAPAVVELEPVVAQATPDAASAGIESGHVAPVQQETVATARPAVESTVAVEPAANRPGSRREQSVSAPQPIAAVPAPHSDRPVGRVFATASVPSVSQDSRSAREQQVRRDAFEATQAARAVQQPAPQSAPAAVAQVPAIVPAPQVAPVAMPAQPAPLLVSPPALVRTSSSSFVTGRAAQRAEEVEAALGSRRSGDGATPEQVAQPTDGDALASNDNSDVLEDVSFAATPLRPETLVDEPGEAVDASPAVMQPTRATGSPVNKKQALSLLVALAVGGGLWKARDWSKKFDALSDAEIDELGMPWAKKMTLKVLRGARKGGRSWFGLKNLFSRKKEPVVIPDQPQTHSVPETSAAQPFYRRWMGKLFNRGTQQSLAAGA